VLLFGGENKRRVYISARESFFSSRKLISRVTASREREKERQRETEKRVHFADTLFSQAESLRGLHRRIIVYGPPRKNEMFTLKISASPCMYMCVE